MTGRFFWEAAGFLLRTFYKKKAARQSRLARRESTLAARTTP